MAVSFVASSTLGAVAANPPSFSLTLPTLLADDIIIIAVMSKNIVEASNEINTPSGYTEKGTKLEVDSGTAADDMRTAMFYKRAVAGDSGASVTISRAGTDVLGLYAVATVWRGAVASGDPFGTTGITTSGSATAGDIIGFAAHDPAENDVHVIYDGWKADDTTTALAAFTNDGTSFGVLDDQETTVGSDCTHGTWDAERGTNNLPAVNVDCIGQDGSYIGYVYSLLPAPTYPSSKKWGPHVLAAWWALAPLLAWSPDVPPQQGRRFFPHETAIVQDQPSPSKQWFNIVQRSWAQDPIILWQNGAQLASGVHQIPTSRPWVPIVASAWEPVPWPAQTARHTPQAGVAQADQPYVNRWLNVIAQWEPEFTVTQGRRFVPIPTAVEEQTPYNRSWLGPLAAWQQDSWEAQSAKRTPPPTPDDPPFSSRRQAQGWEADTWEAQTTRKTSPPTPDDPPFGSKRQAQNWEADSWDTQSAKRTPPPTPDDPPFSTRHLPQGWEPDTWDAQTARHVVQEFVAQADQPSVRPWLSGVIAQWTQEPDQAQARRYVVQEVAAAVNDPIPGYRPWLKTALGSWEPAQLILWQNGILAQSGVDQIQTSRKWLPTVLEAWEPLPYPAQGWKRIVQEAAAAVDAPPERSRLQEAIRQAWQPEEWAAQTTRHVTEGAAAPFEQTPFRRAWIPIIASWEQTLVPLWGGVGIQDADVPPPALKPWLPGVISSWEITWSAQSAPHTPPPTPDAPPITERAWLRAVEQWEALSWDAQTTRHVVPPTPEDPPVTERAWLEPVLRQWGPVPNEAQRRPPQAQFAPATVNDPPFGLRAWLPTVLLAWDPAPNLAQTTPHMAQPGAAVSKPPFGRPGKYKPPKPKPQPVVTKLKAPPVEPDRIAPTIVSVDLITDFTLEVSAKTSFEVATGGVTTFELTHSAAMSFEADHIGDPANIEFEDASARMSIETVGEPRAESAIEIGTVMSKSERLMTYSDLWLERSIGDDEIAQILARLRK